MPREIVWELNRVERRALLLASMLITAGAGVRTAVGPGATDFAWRPAPSEPTAPPSAAEVRARVEEEVAREEEASRPLSGGEKLDPNSAPEEQLRRLSGIGSVRARAIVQARQAEPFRAARDLLRVPGIGEATLARIAPHLIFGGPGPRGVVTPPPAGRGTTGDPGPRLRVNVNQASAEELTRLPWIGPTRARELLETRRRLGRFRSVDELIEVRGIGPLILERLRPYVYAGS